MVDLRVEPIEFVQGGMKLTVSKSKTDELFEGNIVYIYCRCCPIFWLRKYLDAANLASQPSSYVICRLSKTKNGHRADGESKICYSKAIFIDHNSKIVLNAKD